MTLSDLQKIFPGYSSGGARTGFIPMDFVNNHLEEIKTIVKENNLRRIYRGPRYDFTRCWVRRADAYAMVLYQK